MGSIQGFKKGALKKASKAKSKKASKGKGGLLAAIRARPKLKGKAEQTKLADPPTPKPGSRSAAQAMGNAVAKRFKGARGSKKKDNGEDCSEHRECDSQYCNPETHECEDEPDEDWN